MNQEEERLATLKLCIPKLFTLHYPSSCLYIGASITRSECAQELKRAGYEITLVEAFALNADYHRGSKLFKVVIHDDIMRAVAYLPPFDVVFWWHGPEHMVREDLPYLIKRLDSLAKKYIVLACPWGVYEQGEWGGNPHEVHHSHLYPGDFPGWNVMTSGVVDTRGSNMIVWKVKSEN